MPMPALRRFWRDSARCLFHSKAVFFSNLLRCRIPTHVGQLLNTRPCSRWAVSFFTYAPDTHQDQAIGRLRVAECARPWLLRAPENHRYPAVSKSFGFVQGSTSLDILLAVGTLTHASPKQARNRGVSITTAPWHGAMWWMNRRPIIPWGYSAQSALRVHRFIQKSSGLFAAK